MSQLSKCHTYEWVRSQIWVSHVSNRNESFHTYEGQYHIYENVTHTNESGLKYEWVVSQIGMSYSTHVSDNLTFMKESRRVGHVTLIKQSRHIHSTFHTYEWKCHIIERFISSESCRAYKYVMLHKYLKYASTLYSIGPTLASCLVMSHAEISASAKEPYE